MTRITRSVLVMMCSLALCAGLTPAAVASHRPNYFCGDEYCQYATRNRKGIRYLVFRSFVHRGKVKVCVNALDETRSCVKDRFRDGNDDGVFVSRLRWSTNFPNKGSGSYTVRWRQNGERIGKILGFHKP
ncbi:MAG: hypothetical protein M3124_06905 [Actinomycetota bacterium]|nr:hypothetical protein [Actinomycetota bacterium]